MFGFKTRRLSKLVFKELEQKGYSPCYTEKKLGKYTLAAILPDNIIKFPAEELKKFEDTMKDIKDKYLEAEIKHSRPLFSAGGVYAPYISVKPAELVRVL